MLSSMNMKILSILLLLLVLVSCGIKEKNRTRSVIMPDEQTVHIFRLQNKNGISLEAMEYGAILLNISIPDRSGKFENIVAGYDSAQSYFNDKSYFGAIVGRYANRIASGRFNLNGKEYTLLKNEKNINHLHGGISGFNKKIWKGSVVSTKGGDKAVQFTYNSPDGEEGYPGNLNITVTYTLNDSDELRIDYKATTNKPTIVNLTNHSYFNLTGDFNSKISDHQLEINADSFLTVDQNLIPTGNPVPVKGTPFDFRTTKSVGKDIFVPDSQFIYCNGGYDHNFVLKKGPVYKGLSFVARLSDPMSGRIMEVYSDQPGVQFYTGNFLDGSVTGKKGCIYNKYGALTLETQKYPDSPNHPQYPSTVLLPGETYQQHTVLKFKTLNEGRTYTNPIINKGLADPNIKYDSGYYYLLATGKAPDGRFIPIYRSRDLIKWDFVRGAVERGNITYWNYKNFWAPEVYKINGKFYLYYTASPQESPKNSGNRVGLAISDSIQGPYKNVGVVVPHASIDGHVFTDKDGSMYIFYTIENLNKDSLKAGQIYADKLLSPFKVSG